jgi:uncharacterized protein (TIGR03435 family)
MSVMRIFLRWATILSAICAVPLLIGQDQPKFETASVKRMERGIIHNSMGPATVILRGDPLKIVLMEAFKVRAYQIVGPSWLDEECYEIVAKMPESATRDKIAAMLQALLVERFKLAAHKENLPRPVYALVVDHGGPKFKDANMNFRPMGPRPGEMMFRAALDTQGFKGAMTMARLAQLLSGRLDRPVQDFTGLKGTYDIDLAWAPDPSIDRPFSAGSFTAATAALGDTGADLPAAPTATLFTAIRESLGLKLEPRKEPVEMLVIDHVERVPTEN